LNEIVINVRVAARFAQTKMLFCIHSSGDEWQKVRAVSGRTHSETMCFSDHVCIDVPPPERPCLDVLRAECLCEAD
jgi:hypothetical protein